MNTIQVFIVMSESEPDEKGRIMGRAEYEAVHLVGPASDPVACNDDMQILKAVEQVRAKILNNIRIISPKVLPPTNGIIGG